MSMQEVQALHKRGKLVIEYRGQDYVPVKNCPEIPDFSTMSGIEAAMWLIKYTHPRGRQKQHPLDGYKGSGIEVTQA